ncbi:MAG: hypothetical protein AAGK05_17325, partial [Pseudomonadota bacterium]
FVKPTNSENSLRRDSWVPSNVKSNFIKNSIKEVSEKCSSEELRKRSLSKLYNRFRKNGYHKQKFDCKKKRNQKVKNLNSGGACLVLDFISDRLNRKINTIVKKYDMKVRVINKPSTNTQIAINQNSNHKSKHPDCEICESLPNQYMCSDRFLVYKFTCNICQNFYIGQTSRPFSVRFKEHMRSVHNRDNKSALSQHVTEAHKNQSSVTFKCDVIKKCFSPLDTRLIEARAIDCLRPSLNRKHERNW